MNWIRNLRPSPGTAFGLAALLVALGGVAFAAIPDSTGTIHACFQKDSGGVRIVDAASACRKSEQPIAWAQGGAGPEAGRVHVLGDVTLSDGESQVLFTQGPLTYTARCLLNRIFPEFTLPVPRDKAAIIISTTEDHSAFSSTFGDNSDFGPSTPESDREAARAISGEPNGQPVFRSEDLSAATPSGTRLSGVLNEGVNVLGRQGKCVFGGHLVAG